MKKFGKILLWILGITVWLFFLIIFQMADMTHGTPSHLLLLTITGILLGIYILRRTGSGAKELEKEIQELKTENQRLREELADQAVRRAMDKAEKKGE